jgi:V8-like Glu-specific endopeptidase
LILAATDTPRQFLTESTQRAVEAVSADDLLDQANAVRAALDLEGAEGGDARAHMLETAQKAIEQLRAKPDDPLTFEYALSLEALVKVTGRPAFAVRNGTISVDAERDPQWYGPFSSGLFDVRSFSESVGRIDLDGAHVGTGSVIAPGIIMTNRHVLEGIAEEIAGRNGSSWAFARGEASIDFSDTANGSRRFRIKGVIGAGNDAIRGRVVLSQLDMALLDVETVNGDGLALPPRLDLAGHSDVTGRITQIVTIGYPARPSTKSMVDPKTEQFRPDVMNRINEIFGLTYGKKYLAPGQIELVRGRPRGDKMNWTFTHDATTLGGNSGSPVVELSESLAIQGLHFAGWTLVENYAHSLNAVRLSAALPALAGVDARWA